MKRTLFAAALLFVFAGMMVLPSAVLADHETGDDGNPVEHPTSTGEPVPSGRGLPNESEVPTTGGELLNRIDLIGNWVFAIFLAISIIYILMAAFQFVTGGPEGVSEARQKLILAAVGIAIALIAAGFDDIIRNVLTGV